MTKMQPRGGKQIQQIRYEGFQNYDKKTESLRLGNTDTFFNFLIIFA